MPISLRNREVKQQLLRIIPLAVLLILCVLLATGIFNRSVMEPKPSYVVGATIRDFKIPRLDSQGTVTRSDLLGKIVVVNFFASWCKSCLIEHPVLMKMAQTGKVEIIGIAWKNKPDQALAWLKKHGNPYHKIGVDNAGQTTLAFAVSGLPETFIIDPEGKIAYHYRAPLTDEVVNKVVLPMVEFIHEKYSKQPTR